MDDKNCFKRSCLESVARQQMNDFLNVEVECAAKLGDLMGKYAVAKGKVFDEPGYTSFLIDEYATKICDLIDFWRGLQTKEGELLSKYADKIGEIEDEN